ncbi:MAG: FHA domain-containing protein [Planctomycetes bacterium]|nr:FHA domain-containing protein [Planctomycetota bacterium]
MKVSLVVASGTHQGKVIPITVPQFLIGREPQCNLRPASQAISKKHCGIITRGGKVFVADYGSTNGTLVNDELIRDQEVEVEDGTLVMVGPLDFTLRVEKELALDEGTPYPNPNPEALAAVKAVSAPTAPSRDNTPNPTAKPAVSTGSKESPALTDSKEAAALKAAAKPVAKPPAAKPAQPSTKITATSSSEEDNDNIAAMLLGMDDGESVPDGSTVMEMPAMFAQETQTGTPATKPAEDKNKKATSREDMTNAANDILRKMRRRPT